MIANDISRSILNYLSLISYTITWQPRRPASRSDTKWLETLSELLIHIAPTHSTILSTLTLLSNSLMSGQSLPPYINLPRPYGLTSHLLQLRNPSSDGIHRDNQRREASTSTGQPSVTKTSSLGLGSILGVQDVEERGFTEFAVLQVCSTLLCDDLEGLCHAVSGLVGVVDFSFRVDVDSPDSDLEKNAGVQSQAIRGGKGKGKAE